jgi:hypothetical protein
VVPPSNSARTTTTTTRTTTTTTTTSTGGIKPESFHGGVEEFRVKLHEAIGEEGHALLRLDKESKQGSVLYNLQVHHYRLPGCSIQLNERRLCGWP